MSTSLRIVDDAEVALAAQQELKALKEELASITTFEQSDAEKIREIADNKLNSLYQTILGYIQESAEKNEPYRIWPKEHCRPKKVLEKLIPILTEKGFVVELKHRWWWQSQTEYTPSKYYLLIKW